MKINKIIERLSKDPFNPEINFEAALEYEGTGQSASAVSFFLRAAEYGYDTHPIIVYTSLLKVANCFEDQNDRKHTVSNCILQAIAHLPERPEGYFLLSKFYERNGDWQECYTFAELGIGWGECYPDPLPANVGYLGIYCLEFEKAVSAWWIGRQKESQEILLKLSTEPMSDEYVHAVRNNIERIGVASI
jgi:hypothetical protein